MIPASLHGPLVRRRLDPTGGALLARYPLNALFSACSKDAKVEHTIDTLIAEGRIDAWEDAGLLVVDWECEAGRAIVKDAFPNFERSTDDGPVVITSTKRFIAELFGQWGDTTTGPGEALVIFVTPPARIVALRFSRPKKAVMH